ncbi:MAG: response regulator [Deltaproteobacteria bacterium]
MTIEEAFGAVIRRLRKERFLSQEALSKISSLDRVFISQLERGKQQPTLITIFGLAAALSVSVSTMLTETELLLIFNKVKLPMHDFKAIPYEILWEQFGGNITSENPAISSPKTILIADDEMFLCQFLSELLTSQGYNVLIATDGQDAIDMYKENPGTVDLVLMDIMMQRKDGITAYKEISKFDPNARILLMSAYSSTSLGNMGNFNFIQKPMLPPDLFNNIRELLDSVTSKSLSVAEAQPVLPQ